MVAHKRRNGQRIICYWCKTGKHQFCENDNDNEYIHCHCSCQPECTEPRCRTVLMHPRRKKPNVWKADDPRWER